jgi:predicted nucleic acid-binding protein
MRTVFCDANVLIAAAGSRSGASRAILNLAEMGMIKLLVSRQIVDEVERNLRRKLPQGLPFLAEWLTHVDLQLLPDPEPEQFSRWLTVINQTDAPVLEAAVTASADYFITLNTRHFTADVVAASNLTIYTPAEFIENIRAVLSHYM